MCHSVGIPRLGALVRAFATAARIAVVGTLLRRGLRRRAANSAAHDWKIRPHSAKSDPRWLGALPGCSRAGRIERYNARARGPPRAASTPTHVWTRATRPEARGRRTARARRPARLKKWAKRTSRACPRRDLAQHAAHDAARCRVDVLMEARRLGARAAAVRTTFRTVDVRLRSFGSAPHCSSLTRHPSLASRERGLDDLESTPTESHAWVSGQGRDIQMRRASSPFGRNFGECGPSAFSCGG